MLDPMNSSDDSQVANDSGILDLQVNGYGGVDFNSDSLTNDQMQLACDRLVSDGVAGILATIITDDLDSMCRRLATIQKLHALSESVRKLIWGIHIEGPFLNAEDGYIGAHPAREARPADGDSMKRLLDAAGGLTRIVTLAPERDADEVVTKLLSNQNIRVSAGHCNPTSTQLRRSIDAGLTMFTHLGNGCPANLPRHDNIIQRVLGMSDCLDIGLIADGVHIPFSALKNYLKCVNLDRVFVVTDAIAAAGLGPGTYPLGGQSVVVDETGATWSPDKSHLIGSATTMRQSADNLKTHLALDDAFVRRLLVQNPRRAIGINTSHDK
jgi:N-acetylglucosamine-6-phosphate deacetylase